MYLHRHLKELTLICLFLLAAVLVSMLIYITSKDTDPLIRQSSRTFQALNSKFNNRDKIFPNSQKGSSDNITEKEVLSNSPNEGLLRLNKTQLNYKYSLRCQIDEMDITRKISKKRIANEVVTDYRQDLRQRFQETVDKQLPSADPRVLALVSEMLDAPSTHIPKNSRAVVQTPQSEYVSQQIYNNQHKGFFIECGALDGERSSNTLYMEQHLNWQGLLIEADPYFYTQLLGKNRRAWSINACLSPVNHTSWLRFYEDTAGKGAVIEENANRNVQNAVSKRIRQVPCFPLESILLTLNQTSVDYFSLDVEGQEINIIKAIDHDLVNARIWTVEFDHVGENALLHAMEERGYEKVHKIDKVDYSKHIYARDLVFIKKNSLELL